MKTPDRYRFSLQWGADTTEKVQAGDVLKKLGNKKSEFIVLAVTEYLKAHPDITPDGGQKINIIVQPGLTRELVEAMVKDAIREQLAGFEPDAVKTAKSVAHCTADLPETPDESSIDVMIKNLDMFLS